MKLERATGIRPVEPIYEYTRGLSVHDREPPSSTCSRPFSYAFSPVEDYPEIAPLSPD